MLDKNTVRQFAQSLVDAWNRHDLAAIMSHYAEDVVFTNPLILLLVGKPDGVLRGRETIRPYWADVLRNIPHLHFKVHDVYPGVNGFAVHYQGIFERETIEVFTLDDKGKIASSTMFLENLNMP
ncbi:hypothetical protein NNJEOMEG_02222 [Fundidesulfovibrio magnetotacticus]|uniref:SnoaL-like domain-containing protein n=1 Tax=Fundidesulfovibrio magnetotacticus TaxID=2730080 RepID=A0A6V8LVP6_9BACT|nr:nuclear transport factor 2 family protein [Fundidesulfovibrio magnetotacticus]GFK94378.1 hypothetical protein NNJEOMEG_02222 [Fundidesulfovibrio magnetotacticus]